MAHVQAKPIYPVDGTVFDRALPVRFRWDAHEQDGYRVRYRVVGTATWTLVPATVKAPYAYEMTPNRYHDFPAGTFAAGDYEWQVAVSTTAQSPGYSASAFFTAKAVPDVPSITSPVGGSQVPQTFDVTWSALAQDAYQIRFGPGPGVPLTYDSGVVENATARTHSLTMDKNHVNRQIDVRVRDGGLWSNWGYVTVGVSYIPPLAPAATAQGSSRRGANVIAATNPDPGDSGAPNVIEMRLWARTKAEHSGKDPYRPRPTGVPIARSLPTHPVFDDFAVAHGVEYEYAWEALGDNGTSTMSEWFVSALAAKAPEVDPDTFEPVSPTPTGRLTIAAVTASADDGNVPANTLDGDLTTRWSANGDGQWIRYDLGSLVTVGSWQLAWHQGDVRVAYFDIETSSDGAAWTRVWSGQSSGTTLQLEAYNFPDVSARYVRIVGHGNSANTWNSITEVAGYGADATVAAPAAATLSVVAGDAQATLDWNLPSGAVRTSHVVKRATVTGGPYTTVATLGADVTSYIDTGLTNGTTYFWVVDATNADGTSSSNEATATPAGTAAAAMFTSSDILRVAGRIGKTETWHGDGAAPGDWTTIVNRRNSFAGNPTAYGVWSVSGGGSGDLDLHPTGGSKHKYCIPPAGGHKAGYNGYADPFDLTCAAFHAAVTEDATTGKDAAARVLAQVRTARADFWDTTIFARVSWNATVHPGYVIGQYVWCIVLAADYLHYRGWLSNVEYGEVAHWGLGFWDWAGRRTRTVQLGQYSSGAGATATATGTASATYQDHHECWNGGPFTTKQGYELNNRSGELLRACVLAGAAAKIAGVDAVQADAALAAGRDWVMENIIFQAHPSGAFMEFYRWNGTNVGAVSGMAYAASTLGHCAVIAHILALRGNVEVLDFTTTGGTSGTDSHGHGIVTAGTPSGSTGKTLLRACQDWARHTNGTYKRTAGPSTATTDERTFDDAGPNTYGSMQYLNRHVNFLHLQAALGAAGRARDAELHTAARKEKASGYAGHYSGGWGEDRHGAGYADPAIVMSLAPGS